VTQTQSPTSEDNALKQFQELSLAVTDTAGIEELQQDYEPFRAALATALGITVNFFPVDNYIAAAPAMLSGQIDLAFAGPSEYLVLKARAKAVPLLALTRPNFKAVIVVRADSKIQSLQDLKGKKIDMHTPGSTSAHLGAVKLLMDAGLDPKKDFTIVMSGKHSLHNLISGEVDATARASHRYEQILQKEKLSPDQFRVIATGENLPNDVFVVSSLLQPAVVKALHDRMLQNQDVLVQAIVSVPDLAEKFSGATLTTANDSDYEMIRQVYKAIGQEELIQ
jgi:phosphonate transport system substrate-binding protein